MKFRAMPSKKVKVQVAFDKNTFKPIKKTLGLSKELSILKNDRVVKVVKWSKEDVFAGKERLVTHLDSITLEISPSAGYPFQSTLASGSYFAIPFARFKIFDTLQLSFIDDKLEVSGRISIEFGVKDVVYDDFTESGLVNFQSLNVRVKESGELLTFSKYGEMWQKEKGDRADFKAGLNEHYIANQPVILLE